jgi:hypothetical protein
MGWSPRRAWQQAPAKNLYPFITPLRNIIPRIDAVVLKGGLSPAAKILDLKARLRCRGCGSKRRAVVSVKWWGQGAVKGCGLR